MRVYIITTCLSAIALAASMPAAAQGCAEAETAVRSEAAILGPMRTRLDQIEADYDAAVKELDDINDRADKYGWDDESDFAASDLAEYLTFLDFDRFDLLAQILPLEETLKEKVAAYTSACGASARATELLAEYGIEIDPAR